MFKFYDSQLNQNMFLLIGFLLFLAISSSSSADISHFKHKHHHAKANFHRKTSQYFGKNEPNDSNENHKRTLPPNIWALLTENSIVNFNQLNGSKYIDESANKNEIETNVDFEPPSDDESIKQTSFKCPKCSKNSVKMGEDELTSLRIEYVKNQILHKLRMNERPPKKSIDDLPEPIQEGYAVQNDKDIDYFNRHLDDYFAKTTQKIIFLAQEFDKCKTLEYPSVCFTLQIPADLDVSTIDSAHLWIYKEPNNSDHGMNHTFLLSEVEFEGTSKKFIKSKTLAISEVEQNNNGWEKVDLTWPLKTWTEYRNLDHNIQIACETCVENFLPISLHPDHKPFIVVDTFPQRNLKRQKRNVNCGPTSTECCRDSLYVDFATIGWNDWIIHPKGYNAYFCRGSCNRVASITQAGAHHSAVFNKFLHYTSKSNKKKLELVPCCTATRYSSLQIFYVASNNTATQATLPNMIVESCGCS